MKRFAFLLSLTLIIVSSGYAQDSEPEEQTKQQTPQPPKNPEAKKKPSKKNGRDNRSGLSLKRKARLLEFVRENHPELETLLSELESKKPRQYRGAMQNLNKAVAKIESVRDYSLPRYKLAIKQWSIESRMKVAAAEYRLDPSDENHRKVRELVAERFDFQIHKMKFDHESLIERAEILEQRTKEMENQRDTRIENRVRSLLRKKKS